MDFLSPSRQEASHLLTHTTTYKGDRGNDKPLKIVTDEVAELFHFSIFGGFFYFLKVALG